MPPHGKIASAARARRAAVLFLGGALAACSLTLAACGGDDEPATGTGAEPASARTTAQPPLEVAPEDLDATGDGASVTTSREVGEGQIAAEPKTGSQPCPDVVVVPDSGNGLFEIEAEGITCEDARVALEAWGRSGYPGDAPPGFTCEQADPADDSGRLRCRQQASGAVVEFETGV